MSLTTVLMDIDYDYLDYFKIRGDLKEVQKGNRRFSKP